MREKHSPWSYFSLEPNETVVLANHRGEAEVGVFPPGCTSRCENVSAEMLLKSKQMILLTLML